MQTHYPEGNAMEDLLERRWFASMAAMKRMQAECELMRGVLETAETAWRSACAELARMEALHIALGNELARREDAPCDAARQRGVRAISSAA